MCRMQKLRRSLRNPSAFHVRVAFPADFLVTGRCNQMRVRGHRSAPRVCGETQICAAEAVGIDPCDGSCACRIQQDFSPTNACGVASPARSNCERELIAPACMDLRAALQQVER